jgi:hypothetical protein
VFQKRNWLVHGRYGISIATAAMQVVHGDVQVDLATRRFNTNDHGLGFDVS